MYPYSPYTLLRSSATVGGVGMIGGTGTLANLTAESGGVVSPGDGVNPFGTLTVAGNLKEMFKVLEPASDLEFRYGMDAPTIRIEGMTVAGT